MLERVCRPGALADSWQRVLANDAEDDVLSPGVRRFARDADTLLDELRGRLLDGGYSTTSSCITRSQPRWPRADSARQYPWYL